MSLPYRPNVGAVLFNAAGLVLVARRADRIERLADEVGGTAVVADITDDARNRF
jgi:NADP-dependent 3-hydroxy acid dehydrogenase YdfG